ncbi:MAG: aldehyde:ferredoxin oxidoreductase [Planctomycetota bacterium]
MIEVEIRGDELAVNTTDFQSDVAHLDGLGCLGGSGLALALLAGQSADSGSLAISVGNAVGRNLPSSGRICLAGVSPLTGLLAEAALGGDAAVCLASLGDGLLLRGQAGEAGAAPRLLVLEFAHDQGGQDGKDAHDDQDGQSPTVTGRLLPVEQGTGSVDRACHALAEKIKAERPGAELALLTIGQAGLDGSPMAMVRTGTSHVSSAGRGGLGALIGAMGLCGIAIRAAEPVAVNTAERKARPKFGFSQSPRLGERSKSGTLELFGAFAARGELSGRNYSEFLDAAAGAKLADEAKGMQRERHGCKGCSTPCGLVFERTNKGSKSDGKGTAAEGKRTGARFSASWALGPNLGLETFSESLELLALCDEYGVDAREAGACLALLALATEEKTPIPEWMPQTARFGDLEGLGQALGHLPAMGSSALAKVLGLEHKHFLAQGGAARPEGNFASTLGQIVCTGGNDPMRVFPFLVASPTQRQSLPDGTAIPSSALDPRSAIGKGRVVAWHEDLAAALDIAGFCCFSAAGLIADGVATLDELGTWIAPAALGSAGPGRPWAGSATKGEQLLAAGRALVLARRHFNEQLNPQRAPFDVPAWARDELAMKGMVDEYQVVRGLDAAGRLVPSQAAWMESDGAGAERSAWDEARIKFTSELVQRPGPSDIHQGTQSEPKPRPGSSSQEISLLAGGSLGAALGQGEFRLRLAAPETLGAVLEDLACAQPKARPLLFTRGGILPTVWRDGQRLDPDAIIHPGDRLNLLVVLAGG